MKKKNVPICLGILTGFCILAIIANTVLDYNYMFLVAGDGTPYDILYNLVGGNPILYPISVILLFFIYIFAFYFIYWQITKKKNNKPVIEESAKEEQFEALTK